MPTFELRRPALFSLGAASTYYAGFTPGSGMAAVVDEGLTFAFALDGCFEPVAVRVLARGDVLVVTHTDVCDARMLAAQLRRMLGLEVDDATFASLADEPLVKQLRAAYPGFWTAAKASPWDAATWSVIAPRISMQAAAKLKRGITERYGTKVELLGREHGVFPSPEALLTLTIDELPEEKRVRLSGLARAALDGKLEAARLRALGDGALADLQQLRGVGPWSAEHIYVRGAAPPDALALHEPRLLDGFRLVTKRPQAGWDDFIAAAEAWRPLRLWVSILLRRSLHDTAGWSPRGASTPARRSSGVGAGR